jgi:hypothetical protein
MSTTHAGAPGAKLAVQVLVHPLASDVTVKVKCTMNPELPQLPAEKVMVCPVLEPTIAHPGGLPSTLIDHDKL